MQDFPTPLLTRQFSGPKRANMITKQQLEYKYNMNDCGCRLEDGNYSSNVSF